MGEPVETRWSSFLGDGILVVLICFGGIGCGNFIGEFCPPIGSIPSLIDFSSSTVVYYSKNSSMTI
jgi:hypothetical protein